MQIHVQHGLRKSRTATLHDSHLPCLSAVVIFTSSTRTRRGGSCLKNIYKTFLIYRTCMRRVPAKPVRACTLRNWRLVSHVTFQAPLHTSHLTVFTLHTSHCTLHTPHFISSELFSPYPSSALLISSLLICHLSFHESLPSTTTKELACAVRQPGLCVRALCEAVAVSLSKNMTCARPRCNAT